MLWRIQVILLALVCLSSCTSGEQTGSTTEVSPASQAPTTATQSEPAASTSSSPTAPATTSTTVTDPLARPAWLGKTTLALRPDGNGEVLPTPPDLAPRVLRTPDVFPSPPANEFRYAIHNPPPSEVIARSSWVEDCPVSIAELSYLTLSHYGFDGDIHTGELLVNAKYDEDIAGVFAQLFEARFPIEEMRVVRLEEVDDPPTGDWNDTTSFVCRPAVGSNGWSQHAFGLAVDINPFHNPYQKADLVIPELASYYTDRSLGQEGMLYQESVAVTAFAEIGWAWGGNWNTLKDWMHFSASGG